MPIIYCTWYIVLNQFFLKPPPSFPISLMPLFTTKYYFVTTYYYYCSLELLSPLPLYFLSLHRNFFFEAATSTTIHKTHCGRLVFFSTQRSIFSPQPPCSLDPRPPTPQFHATTTLTMEKNRLSQRTLRAGPDNFFSRPHQRRDHSISISFLFGFLLTSPTPCILLN